MAIVKDFLCAAHGAFSNTTGKCPSGCSKRFVVQQILTAPGIRSGRTRRADTEMQNLANDYRMTNIKVGSDGESVMQSLRRSDPSKFTPSWGQVDHAAPGFSQRGESAKTYDPASAGVMPASVVQPGMLPPPKPKYTHRAKE